jgi:hypothetical protein
MNHLGTILTVALTLYGLGMCVFLISDNRRPQATLAWMLAFFFAPGLGALIYILFGRDRSSTRIPSASMLSLVNRWDLFRPRICRHVGTCRSVGNPVSSPASHSSRRGAVSRPDFRLMTGVFPDRRGAGTALA